MTTHDPKRGILYMIAATLCLAAGWVGIKFAGERLPTAEVVCLRSLVGLPLLIPVAKMRAGSLWGHNQKLLLLRGLAGLCGMMCLFYGIIHLNMGDASVLLNTFPLFVALLAPFLLKEPTHPRVFFFVIIAFIGIGFILRPTKEIINVAALIGLAGGFFVALAMIAIRKLRATENTWVITFWFSAVVAAGALPFMLMDFVMPTPREWLIILVSGTILTMSQLFVTKAYGYATAATIAPFAYAAVLWSYGLDMLVWDFVPDFWSIVGSGVIIVSSVGSMLIARKPYIKTGATS